MSNLFIGQIVHCKSINELELIPNGFLAVKNGKIVAIGNSYDFEKWQSLNDVKNWEVTHLSESQFLLPGFIDCHIHASQMPNVGLGLDTPLLEWLDMYTIPIETEFKDTGFARHVYEKVVNRTLRQGTTLATYFATNHWQSSVILAEEAIRQGQRAFVGKVSSNCCFPDFYLETTDKSLEDNVKFIEKVIALNNDLVQPIVTPRFAGSCDAELMTKLAKLATEYSLRVQSHISESLGELDLIAEKFKEPYTTVYDRVGILTDKCILAHGVHLDDSDLELIKLRNTSIAHCPSSNTNLRSGICDLRRLLDSGITVGLGTDISGGNKLSILSTIRDTMTVSKHLCFLKTYPIQGTPELQRSECSYRTINYKEALYLATLGGAEALHISDRIGNFVEGKEFDGLIIDVYRGQIDEYQLPDHLYDRLTADQKLLRLLEKFIYVGDDRNILNVYVNGKLVKN